MRAAAHLRADEYVAVVAIFALWLNLQAAGGRLPGQGSGAIQRRENLRHVRLDLLAREVGNHVGFLHVQAHRETVGHVVAFGVALYQQMRR